MDFEFFLLIENYENYFVSNFGNFKINKTNRILKLLSHNQGYKTINLYKNRKRKSFIVHRFVAKAFLENPDEKQKVDHIDELYKGNI